eukprot:6120920-Amphidinium_carterae.1
MAYEGMVTLQNDGKIPGTDELPEAKLWYNYQKAVNKGAHSTIRLTNLFAHSSALKPSCAKVNGFWCTCSEQLGS